MLDAFRDSTIKIYFSKPLVLVHSIWCPELTLSLEAFIAFPRPRKWTRGNSYMLRVVSVTRDEAFYFLPCWNGQRCSRMCHKISGRYYTGGLHCLRRRLRWSRATAWKVGLITMYRKLPCVTIIYIRPLSNRQQFPRKYIRGKISDRLRRKKM